MTEQNPKVSWLNFRSLVGENGRYPCRNHMWLLRRIEHDGFPAPTKMGRLRYWRLDQIEAWENGQIEKSINSRNIKKQSAAAA